MVNKLIVLSMAAFLLLGCGSRYKKDDTVKGVAIDKGSPYLMLISYRLPALADVDEPMLDALAASPYDGASVMLVSPTDPRVPKESEYLEKEKFLLDKNKKRLWPSVFVTRVVGAADVPGSKEAKEYFSSIDTIALDTKGRHATDLLETLRTALRVAKNTNSPGIVLDLEFHTNPDCYKVSYIAGRRGISQALAVEMLKNLGSKIAAVIQEEYSDCVVWLPFTGLSFPDFELTKEGEFYAAPAYIAMGMFDEAKDRKMWSKFIDADKSALGLHFKSVMDLEKRIHDRQKNQARFTAAYGAYVSGGVGIAPWHDASLLTGWFAESVGPRTMYMTMMDFGSTYNTLMQVYKYVWVYALPEAGYDPLDPQLAPIYNAELLTAKKHIWARE